MSDIAIIGLSFRLPEANNWQELYENLKTGKDSIRPLSSERIQATSLIPGKNYKHFAFLENIEQFDAAFFNISPLEADLMSPQQRVVLELVKEMFESAGYSSKKLSQVRTSVFASSNSSDYHRHADDFNPLLLTGNISSGIPGRISRQFNLTGNSVHVDTACSSSLVALHMACQELLNGECQLAVCAGVNLAFFPTIDDSDRVMGITSTDGKSKTFSDAADGAGFGEAVVCVLLKTLSSALSDSDHIMAVIKSSAVNHDASRSSTFAAPSSIAQAEVIAAAIEKSNLDPESITYIEAHGTGTQLGDPIEIEGLRLAFSKFTERRQFAAVSAFKSNIGHCDNASGLAGLVKVVLSFQRRELFQSLHIYAPNPLINFHDAPVFVNTVHRAWQPEMIKRRAGLSSFGISGTNCHVILEEFNSLPVHYAVRPHLICLSAKSELALRRHCEDVIAYAESNSQISLEEVSYAINSRDDYRFRAFVVASSLKELVEALRSISIQDTGETMALPSMWFLFTESVVWPENFLEDMRANCPAFRTTFDELSDLNFSVAKDPERSILFGFSFFKFLQDLGIEVKRIIGHQEGREVVSLIQGKISASDILVNGQNDLAEEKQSPRWKEFVENKLKNGNSVIWEIGIGTFHSKEILKYKAGENFDVANPLAKASFSNLLHFIGDLYNKGFSFNLDALYTSKPRLRPVPGHPLIRKKHWIRLWQKKIEGWCYTTSWSQISKQTSSSPDATPKLFVLHGEGTLCDNFLTALTDQKKTAIHIKDGYEFKANGVSHQFDRRDELAYKNFAAFLGREFQMQVVHIVFCSPSKSENIDENLDGSLNPIVLLTKSFNYSDPGEIVVVTSNGAEIHGEYFINPYASAVFGMMSGIKVELPEVKIRCIDVENPTIEALYEEVTQGDGQQIVIAIRKGLRYGRTIVKAHPNAPVVVKKSGVYVITGGGSGIGLEILKALACYQSTFIVLGRRRLPPKFTWKFITEDSHPDIFNSVKEFLWIEKQGSTVVYHSMDVANAMGLKELLARLENKFGKVHGIIHGAGIGGGLRVNRHSVESFRETLQPKIHGAINLCHAVDPAQLDFFICFSSLNALIGVDRESNYCAANAFLDGFAAMLRQQGICGITIRWPFWTETGMGFRMHQGRFENLPESISITTEEGVQLFQSILENGYSDIVITKEDPSLIPENLYFNSNTTDSVSAQQVTHKSLQSTDRHFFHDLEERVTTIWKNVLSKEAIGLDDNFFRIGGHSLLGIQVRNQIEKQAHLRMEYRDIVDHPTIRQLCKKLRSLSQEEEMQLIPTAPTADLYPLSESQRTLWLAWQTQVNPTLYNVFLFNKTAERIDLNAMKSALNFLIERHEILRTIFIVREEEPWQKVLAMSEMSVPMERVEAADEKEYESFLADAANHSFILDQGPLFKVWIIERSERDTVVFISLHHIIIDGWSSKIFLQELFKCYEAFIENNLPQLAPLRIQYKDYSYWEHKTLEGSSQVKDRDFWKAFLAPGACTLDMPTDFSRNGIRNGRGSIVRFQLKPATSQGIQLLAAQKSLSKFVITLSALQLLLYRYTGQSEFYIGSPGSLRTSADLEHQLGYYVNMLPFYCNLSASDTFHSVLLKTNERLRKIQDHQLYPFDRMLHDSDLKKTAGRNYLFDVTFTYDYQESERSVVESGELPSNSKYDLEFNCVETPDSISGYIIYDVELFKKETVEEIAHHFINLLDILTLNQTIGAIAIHDEPGQGAIHDQTVIDFDI